MPIDNDTRSGLIESIYECVLDRSQWTPTLERLARVFHACNAIIFSQGLRELSFGFEWGVPIEAKIAYAEKYTAIDPMRTMDWHVDIDYPITLARFIEPHEFRKTKFYREYVAPLGWFDFLTVILEKSSTRVTTFGFSRDVTGGPFGDQEAELIRLLAPHVRRATIFHDIFDHAATRALNLAAALDLVETPVLLFDAGGACIEANATAERFFATADAPRADRIPVRANSRILVPGITAAIAAAGTGLATQSLPFTLDRTGGRWFVAHVLPLTGGLRVRMNGQRRAASAMFIQTVGELRPVAR